MRARSGPQTSLKIQFEHAPSLTRRGDAAASPLLSRRAPFSSGTNLQMSAWARQKLALPRQRVAHDAFQVVEMRLPFEHSTGAVGSRHDPCGIPKRRPASSTLKSTPEMRLTLSITSSTEKPRP